LTERAALGNRPSPAVADAPRFCLKLAMRLDPPPAAAKVVFPAATIIPLTAALFAVLPFSTDVYLTTMVDLGREFGVAVAGVQRTLISFTLGFGLAHLAIGRIADRFGRRPTALVGLGLYVAASALAVAAPTLGALVAARFLQGLAAATGPILCRTIIRDAAPPDQAGRWLAKNGAYLGLAPLTAPLIGALLASLGGWRAALAFLVVYGAALLVAAWLRLPETRPAAYGDAPNLPILRTLAELLRHRAFVAAAAALASGYGMLLTWLSTSAFLLIGELGLTKPQASAVYALGSGAYLGGSLLGLRLSRSLSALTILRIAGPLLLLGAAAPALALVEGFRHWAVMLVCVAPFYCGWGLGQPMAIAIAMRPFAHMAGQASAWLGLIQQLGGILFSLIAAALGGGVATPLVMAAAALAFIASAAAIPQPQAGRIG
jgi:DHA1 family bicyclomycin/chloramphenicol resistance-like MFS transporter